MSASDPDADPREELHQLASALRAHVEWQAATGASGLPPSEAQADVEPGPAPSAARSRQEPPQQAAPTPASDSPQPATKAGTSLPLEERQRRLAVLEERVRPCTQCRLHEARKQTVFARGDGSSGVFFVGEGPGADEDAQGYPFVGKAGQLLDRMIAAMGLDREEVYVGNVVKCRPPRNRKPEPDEMAACKPYLTEQIELVDPKVLILLGAASVEGLLGFKGGITRLRGKWRLYDGRISVMPTFHPAYLLRNPAAKRDVWNDLQEVLRHLGRPIPSRK